MVRMAAHHRMILQFAETAGERHVLGAADVLVAEEHDLVLQQQPAHLLQQVIVLRHRAQVDVAQLRAYGAAQRFDTDGPAERCRAHHRRKSS